MGFPRVTLIGKTSFLARHIYAAAQEQNLSESHTPAPHWNWLSHSEALGDKGWVKDSDIVINCAFHPAMRRGDYTPVQDIDFLLSAIIRDSGAHYVMLSTRMVYGAAPPDLILREDMPAHPENAYGRNKLLAEQAATSLLPPERITILRLGNIFGLEPKRPTFFGAMLTSLKDTGIITFDIAPASLRDFLPVGRLAQAIQHVLHAPKGGIYNIGAGFGTSPQELAQWLIEGYGAGEVYYSAQSTAGQFILDTQKAQGCFSIPPYTNAMLEQDTRTLGALLRNTSHQP